jgi:hypothetical protein
MHRRGAILLLNVAHAADHMFLLIFATAVAAIAADFGFARWEDLMPFGVGAFVLFLRVVPPEAEAPARRKGGAKVRFSRAQMARALAVMTVASATGGILFNLTTNGNAQLLTERFRSVMGDPATLGLLLASVYAVASLAQVVVGRLIDRVALKPLYLGIALLQVPVLLFSSQAQGWWLYAGLLGMMIFIFGAIPFTDAMIARHVDDPMRSRVAGLRLAVSLGISSLAVWLLGPLVKGMGFDRLLLVLGGVALCTAFTVLWLPPERSVPEPAAA